jgi:hypothetical protein
VLPDGNLAPIPGMDISAIEGSDVMIEKGP